VTSSASTRIREGCTRLTARYIASASTPASWSGNNSRRRGKKKVQNSRERPTTFSHSRLWDSCTAEDAAAASGVRRNCSGNPCS